MKGGGGNGKGKGNIKGLKGCWLGVSFFYIIIVLYQTAIEFKISSAISLLFSLHYLLNSVQIASI
jgi:hypothetical protein